MEIYTKISKRKYLTWSQQNRGKFAPCMGCANVVRVLCEFRTRFAQAEGACAKFRTSLEQLSSEGHIFVISAPNRTRFEALDS